LDAIIEEKVSIHEGLLPGGVFIINSDFEEMTNYCRARNIKYISFGKSKNSGNRAIDISFHGSGSRFTIEGEKVELPLPGPGNVENALAAWAVCKQFDISVQDFAKAVKSLALTSMRAELLQIGTLTILNDCYNANPASMKNALEILKGIDTTNKRRLVFICGDMAVLGAQSKSLHKELGEHIAKADIDLVLAVGKYSKIAAQSAQANAKKKLQTKCFEDTLTVCNKLHEFIRDYDIILVKGSRTAKLEAAVKKLKGLFS